MASAPGGGPDGPAISGLAAGGGPPASPSSSGGPHAGGITLRSTAFAFKGAIPQSCCFYDLLGIQLKWEGVAGISHEVGNSFARSAFV